MVNAIVVEGTTEVYHVECFDKAYPKGAPTETVEVEADVEDECDFCGGLLIDPIDGDDEIDLQDEE